MAALSYPQEKEEGKERSSLADEAGLFFSEGLMKWQEMLELAAVAFVGSLMGSLLVKVLTLTMQ